MNNKCKLSIICKAMQIKGWFNEIELGLLIEYIDRVKIGKMHYSNPINIVEIGSFKGRSTIAMGLTIIDLHLDAVIYAVDPHEGLRSGRYDRIHQESPTYDDFLQNVRNYGLENVIKCVKCNSTDTILEIPISLLLIDGLHLYENVREDFLHFEKNLLIGSLILFHDYSDDFPGVQRFVNFLLNMKKTSSYVKVDTGSSLIIIEKVT